MTGLITEGVTVKYLCLLQGSHTIMNEFYMHQKSMFDLLPKCSFAISLISPEHTTRILYWLLGTLHCIIVF